MPSISVVMPAYNAESTILSSIKSIQDQTFEDWELIVVDDGSEDSTASAVRSVALLDDRVELVSSVHEGISHARQKGIDIAQGSYLMFCDADDWIEQSAFEEMYKEAQSNNLDMCVCGYCQDEFFGDQTRCVAQICHAPSNIFTTKAEFREGSCELFYERLFQGVTGILYRVQRMNDLNINFRECGWSEHDFIIAYIKDIERVGVISYPFYHFKKYRNIQKTPQRELEILKLCKRDYDSLIELYSSWGLLDNQDIYQKLHEIFLNELTDCIEDICNPSCVIDITHKHQILEMIVEEECTQKAVSVVSPKNRMQQMLIGPIKKKNTPLLYSEARFISFIKHYNSSVVSKESADSEKGELNE